MGHSTKKLDLLGQRFGKLFVSGPSKAVNGRTAWVCQCDCGRQTVVRTSHLRSGHTSSCGCINTGSGLPGLTYIDGTCVEMLRSRTIRKNNTSGVSGVDWRAAREMWRASICFKGKRYYLGSFKEFEDAVNARKQAESEMHDRFLSEFSKSDPQ